VTERARSFDEVLTGAKAGDPVAIASLYRALQPRLLRYLRAMEPVEAEDLASETWLDVAAGIVRFEGDETALRVWALTIARRRAIDLRRARARRRTHPAPLEDLESGAPSGDTEVEAMANLATEEALARLAVLSPQQREVILLRVFGGLSVREVAAIMNRRPGAVRALQHRALRRLARETSKEAVTE
jgi:RNA polymerase sigma-70 factor, ECF subfamily